MLHCSLPLPMVLLLTIFHLLNLLATKGQQSQLGNQQQQDPNYPQQSINQPLSGFNQPYSTVNQPYSGLNQPFSTLNQPFGATNQQGSLENTAFDNGVSKQNTCIQAVVLVSLLTLMVCFGFIV
ncbi:hypothetical protein REPUB_Repub02eG0018600 [Reevesia pubescens]